MIKDSSDLERVNREIQILKKLRHPNVVQLFDVTLNMGKVIDH
jgi:serine/threonine protein kinase